MELALYVFDTLLCHCLIESFPRKLRLQRSRAESGIIVQFLSRSLHRVQLLPSVRELGLHCQRCATLSKGYRTLGCRCVAVHSCHVKSILQLALQIGDAPFRRARCGHGFSRFVLEPRRVPRCQLPPCTVQLALQGASTIRLQELERVPRRHFELL